jgi:uncharacterized protein YecA (UPF0149 family)
VTIWCQKWLDLRPQQEGILPHYESGTMMAHLLADIRTNQEEMRAGQEHPKEEMLAKMEAKIDTNQEKMDAWIAKMRSW